MSKSTKLDLHGIKHEDAEQVVENFVLLEQENMPLTIVCGNSFAMRELVEKALHKMGFTFQNNLQNQFSTIVVTGYAN